MCLQVADGKSFFHHRKNCEICFLFYTSSGAAYHVIVWSMLF